MASSVFFCYFVLCLVYVPPREELSRNAGSFPEQRLVLEPTKICDFNCSWVSNTKLETFLDSMSGPRDFLNRTENKQTNKSLSTLFIMPMPRLRFCHRSFAMYYSGKKCEWNNNISLTIPEILVRIRLLNEETKKYCVKGERDILSKYEDIRSDSTLQLRDQLHKVRGSKGPGKYWYYKEDTNLMITLVKGFNYKTKPQRPQSVTLLY